MKQRMAGPARPTASDDAPPKPSVGAATVEGILICVHGEEEPSDADWAVFLNETRARGRVAEGILVHSLGGGPNARQREAARVLWREVLGSDAKIPDMAVLTASALVRGIVTVAAWFFPRTPRSFAPHEVDAALNHLRIEGSARRAAVKVELERLKATVAP
jgi:hypothetical protein